MRRDERVPDVEDRLSQTIIGMCLVALVLPAVARAQGQPPGTCSLSELDGVRQLLSRSAAAEFESGDRAEFDRRWREFAQAATAVLGAVVPADADARTRANYLAARLGAPGVGVACDAGAAARDRVAYTLGMLGYSLPEIAGIVSGDRSRSEIDTGTARKLACLPPSAAESRPSLAVEPGGGARITPRAPASAGQRLLAARANGGSPFSTPGGAAIDSWARYYAGAYGVDYGLVSAVIQQESDWQPAAVSGKGAIGLMQLMPATAAMLSVNPRDPIDNLRGGIAYLAGLLNAYGSVRSALIAYNAGPAHADQVRRGEREPFPETQRYLDAVGAVYAIGARR